VKRSDKDQITRIYESLDFKSSYDDSFNPQIEKLKTEANQNCHNIEKMISGLITYYKREKDKFLNNPNEMNSFESIDRLESFLRPHLAQFREFRD
jgi:hypothetical protein